MRCKTHTELGFKIMAKEKYNVRIGIMIMVKVLLEMKEEDCG